MRLAILGNLAHAAIMEIIPEWLEWLRTRAETVVAEDLARHLGLPADRFEVVPRDRVHLHCDMVISLGGDGTILSTAQIIGRSRVPILGVKFGGLGFMVEIGPEELYAASDMILAGKFEIQPRMLLEAQIPDEKEPLKFYAMNEVAISKGSHSRMVRLRTHINKEYLNTYISDGLIIATPTGSTAYSLAAGGPILPPEMHAILITPICPHSLSARPVVIPDEKMVQVQPLEGDIQVILSVDGQINRELSPGMVVEIRKADFCVNLVRKPRPQSSGFYDTLRAKLHWGEDIRK